MIKKPKAVIEQVFVHFLAFKKDAKPSDFTWEDAQAATRV